MSVFNERPGSMRGRPSGPQGSAQPFDITMQQSSADTGVRTRSGRKLAPMDTGTVALAVTGMTFYWMMPMLMRRRRPPRPSGD